MTDLKRGHALAEQTVHLAHSFYQSDEVGGDAGGLFKKNRRSGPIPAETSFITASFILQ